MEEIKEQDFNDVIHQGKPFVLVFNADWSGSGELMISTIERVSSKFAIDYDFFSVDIDKSPAFSQSFNIKTIPTTFIFKNQEVVDHFEGMLGSGQLIAKLENHREGG